MATILEKYTKKREKIDSLIKENKLPMNELLIMQELDYRLCVLRTLQGICQTAPLSKNPKDFIGHYQMFDIQLRFLVSERQFGERTDEAGEKRRKTALESLIKVIRDENRIFSSFNPVSESHYKNSVAKIVNAVLAAWIQYRNTYVDLKEDILNA